MKNFTIYLMLFFLTTMAKAQSGNGIVIQGIARDAAHAAKGDETLDFTFQIMNGADEIFKEEEKIKTDVFGVFSHVIGTGNKKSTKSLSEVDFGLNTMRLVVSVKIESSSVILSDEPFRYVPYAYHAYNGVPAGTVVAFVGKEDQVPSGWMLCNGQAVTDKTTLKTMMDYVPDLRGMFLRGADTNTSHKTAGGDFAQGPALNQAAKDGYKSHQHSAGGLEADKEGNHYHSTTFWQHNRSFEGDDDGAAPLKNAKGNNGNRNYTKSTNTTGEHKHSISGATAFSGQFQETRPVNYGVNYIIKL